MKKIAVFLCVLLMSVFMAGCGEVIQDTPTDKPTITVRYYYAGYGREYMEQFQADFNARAQKGEYDFYISALYDSNISASLPNLLENEGLAVPDVALVNSFPSLMYGRRGLLVELDDVYATEVTSAAAESGKESIKDKMFPQLEKNYNVEGHYYGLPIQSGVTGIVYNAELFEEYDLPVPTTMAGLWDLMDQIDRLPRNTNGSSGDDIYSFIYPSNATYYWDYLFVPMFLQLMGEEAYYDMINVEDLAEAESSWEEYEDVYLTVFENVEKLQTKANSNRLTTGQNHTLSLAAFAQEKALMTPCGDWSWNEIQNSTDPSKLDIMAAPLVCDPVTELVIAQATPSSEVFEGVDMSDAEAVAEAEKGYFKVARAEVSPSVIPESDADAEYIYFKKYTYSMAGQMEAVIPAGAKNIEYAKEFLTYLCTDDSLSLYTKYTGSNMPYEKSNTDPAINPDFYTFNTHCLELGQYGASIVSGSTTKAVRYGFASMLPGATMYIDLLNGSSTPDTIFTRMTDSIRRGMEGLEGLINNYEKDFIK